MSSIGLIADAAVNAGVISGVIALLVGIVAGAFVYKILLNKKIGNSKSNAVKIIEEAYAEAKSIKKESVLEAKEEAQKIKEEANTEARERRGELQKQEERLDQREEYLTKKETLLDTKSTQLDNEKAQLDNEKVKVAEQIKEQNEIKEQMLEKLEQISGLSKKDAKDLLIESVTEEARKDAGILVKQIEDEAKEKADKIATDIVVGAIQKCATDLSSEMTISTVALPNDEMKGRIIGREGRNIRSIESVTGVELIVDDTPETITISSFDPIRREIARLSLEKLIVDGRIHPARIEEMVEKAQREVEVMIKEEGESATLEVGVHGIHPELVKLLGKMKFRTSYGQNALKHSIEVAHLTGLLAAEMGLDVRMAKRAGLLHDIGKSVDHEMEGSHIQLGADLCRKYKESAIVINAVESHHGDVEAQSLIACLVQAADTISAARPGARRETLETYTTRLKQLEDITNNFKGVDKSFAIQAGREIRVMVVPEQISDSDMVLMARDISKQIEAELEYPGQIKVNVIRESRVIDYAK